MLFVMICNAGSTIPNHIIEAAGLQLVKYTQIISCSGETNTHARHMNSVLSFQDIKLKKNSVMTQRTEFQYNH